VCCVGGSSACSNAGPLCVVAAAARCCDPAAHGGLPCDRVGFGDQVDRERSGTFRIDPCGAVPAMLGDQPVACSDVMLLAQCHWYSVCGLLADCTCQAVVWITHVKVVFQQPLQHGDVDSLLMAGLYVQCIQGGAGLKCCFTALLLWHESAA
jgi:hypothetical protein